MTDDLTRARQHLNDAAKSPAGGAAEGNALIGIGLALVRISEQLDAAAAPLRFHYGGDHVDILEGLRGPIGPSQAERERAQVAEADRRAARDRAIADEVRRVREETRAQLREDESGWSPAAGGVFGQMEERPNDLEDGERH